MSNDTDLMEAMFHYVEMLVLAEAVDDEAAKFGGLFPATHHRLRRSHGIQHLCRSWATHVGDKMIDWRQGSATGFVLGFVAASLLYQLIIF